MALSKRRIAFLSHYNDPESLPVLEKAAFQWIQTQPEWQVELLTFNNAEKLSDFDAAWWYYAEKPELPQAAIDAVDTIKSYVESGGKLLLSLIAAKYVEPLGLDRAPDAVKCSEVEFFYWNGYVALEKHPIFEGLSKGFFVAGNNELKPFVNARWLAAPPENGRVLAIANWGARFVEDERVVVEWDAGLGQVLATGMHNFRFDIDPSENLMKFAGNIFRYITAPLIVDLSLTSDNPVVPTGAGYLGGHYKDGGVVVETGQSVRATVSGKAWKSLDMTITARTPSGAIATNTSLSTGQEFSVEIPLVVDGLTEGENTAAIEVMSGDEIISTAEQEFFIIPKSEGNRLIDEYWLWAVRSKQMAVEIDKSKGSVWGLYDPSVDKPVQFSGNPDMIPAIATSNHRWLGDLVLKYRFDGDLEWRSMTTAESVEIRRVQAQDDSVVVVYDPGPPEQIGPTEPMVSERYSIDGDTLNWRIRIKNRSQSGMVLGELGMPLALNTCFAGEVDMEEIYERKVMLHSFIGGSSSWILASPLGGVPPYLLIWCKEDTKLEAIAHINEYGTKPDGWEGLINVFPYSKASRETRNWYEWYNGHTAAAILPGEEIVLNFGIKFIRDYSEIGDTLYESGKVAVDVAPGMVIPTDMTAYLKVLSKRNVTVQGDRDTVIEPMKTDGDISTYRIRFETAGQHNIKLIDDAGEVTSVHFMGTEPIEKLAKANGAHIARDEQYRGPGVRNGMFFMWDAELNSKVMKPRHQFMSGGSDEIGYSEPLILVWKNVVHPVPEEIEAIEYYVENFLFGGVQNKETYAVSTGITEGPDEVPDYTRSFNYPHVVNIYFGLSKIAENYGLTSFRTADEYLLMAYRTAIAYYTLPMYKNNTMACGNFGEALYFYLLEALREKGHTSEADELERYIRRKAEYFLSQKHPYLSEYPFDTTGYSDAYYLKKFAGGVDGAKPVVSMLRGTRGRQHSWHWYGGDVRWGWGCSKYQWPDELCLNYMINQNGRALLDNFHETGHIEDLRLGYASFLAYWALIEPNGVAHNLYTWEPTRMTYDPWTSEMGCGFYFGFLMACSYAVDDPDFGLIGYGCDVDGDINGHISIIPRDGVARRVRVHPTGIEIESNATRIERADIEDSGKKIVLLLAETLGTVTEDKLVIRGIPEGNYKLSTNYIEQATFTAEECAKGIRVPVEAGASVPVHLVKA